MKCDKLHHIDARLPRRRSRSTKNATMCKSLFIIIRSERTCPGSPVENSIRRNCKHWISLALEIGAGRMNFERIINNLCGWVLGAGSANHLYSHMRKNANEKRKWRWLVYLSDLSHSINCITEQPTATCRHLVSLLFIRFIRNETTLLPLNDEF